MQVSKPKYLIVGRVGSAHGVKGENKIISYTDPPTNILNYLPWQLSSKGQLRSVSLEKKRHDHHHIIVQFSNCMDRDQAQLLTGADILIPREQLKPLKKGEFYQTDLIGLQVDTVNGEKIGTVKDILETGANDVLVIVGEKRYLIPYILDSVIKEIDLEKQIILVDWDVNF